MIQVLGIKRIMALGILLGLNILLALVVYLYYIPHNDDLTQQLQTVTSQATQKRTDTNNLLAEYQIIQDQKARFEDLKAVGFFSNQNRAVARQRIEEIQKFTNVLSAKYNINAAMVENNQQAATDANYIVLDSPVTITLEALDDVDIYNFVYWIENSFPGHAAVTSLEIERALDVNEAVLRQIGGGTPTTLIKATLGFNWRTMIPNQQPAAAGAPKG